MFGYVAPLVWRMSLVKNPKSVEATSFHSQTATSLSANQGGTPWPWPGSNNVEHKRRKMSDYFNHFLLLSLHMIYLDFRSWTDPYRARPCTWSHICRSHIHRGTLLNEQPSINRANGWLVGIGQNRQLTGLSASLSTDHLSEPCIVSLELRITLQRHDGAGLHYLTDLKSFQNCSIVVYCLSVGTFLVCCLSTCKTSLSLYIPQKTSMKTLNHNKLNQFWSTWV